MLAVKLVNAKCLVTAMCLLRVALGKGSAKTWSFDVASTKTFGATAMVFLDGIQQAVIFGRLEDYYYYYFHSPHDIIYVTTMTESNELSDCTVLEGVLDITSAVAHPTDDNIVLVTGEGVNWGHDDYYSYFHGAFVGALFVEGENKYHWEMFNFVDEGLFEKMYCIEALPRSNVFVAAGNSDGAGKGNGMIFAVYDLDDFSKLYIMQHTAKYGSNHLLGSARPKAMARIGATNDVVVVNWNHGLCRFSVLRDTMQLKWCRYFTSEFFENIVGVHVVNNLNSILVTGYKDIGNHIPFVRHFDLQGEDEYCYLWQFDYMYDSVLNVQVFTSFHDDTNDTVYLGCAQEYRYSSVPLLLVYNATGRHLTDERRFYYTWNISSEFFPKSFQEISKSKNGTLMFAMEPVYDWRLEENALVTMTDTNCLRSHWDNFEQYNDDTIENTAVTTEYFGEYTTFEEVTDYDDHDFVDAQTHWTETVCPVQPNTAKDGNGQNLANLVTIGVVFAVGGLCVCVLCVALIKGQMYTYCFNKLMGETTQNRAADTDTEAMVPSTTVAMATVSTEPVAAVSDVVDEQRIAELQVGVATDNRMKDSQTAAATYEPMAASTPGVYMSEPGSDHSEDSTG